MSKLRLNLLQALDVLLTERHVSRAAERLFVTQSSMSNILKKLREVFHDDLLVTTGRTMMLTQKAEALRPRIKQLISLAAAVFQTEEFDPKTSTRKFGYARIHRICFIAFLVCVSR